MSIADHLRYPQTPFHHLHLHQNSFTFSILNVFLTPIPFSSIVQPHNTAAASSWPKYTAEQTKTNRHLTFVGFRKRFPAAKWRVISLDRQDRTMKYTMPTWTVTWQILHLIWTLNSSSYQRLLNFPTKIVYSLLILVAYAKMHKFQSQYVSKKMANIHIKVRASVSKATATFSCLLDILEMSNLHQVLTAHKAQARCL